jgi:hypothetical protein
MFLASSGALLVEVWPTLPDEYGESETQQLLARHCKRFILRPFSECWLDELHNPNYVKQTYRIMIERLVPHRFTGLEPNTTFFESSTEDFASDSYRAIESKGIDAVGPAKGRLCP